MWDRKPRLILESVTDLEWKEDPLKLSSQQPLGLHLSFAFHTCLLECSCLRGKQWQSQQQHNNSNPENRYLPLRKAHSNRRHGLLCFIFYIIIKRFLSTRARQNIKYHPWKGVKNVSGFQYDVTGTIPCAEKVYARSPTGRVKEETVSPVSKFVEKTANQLSQNYLVHKCSMEEHHSLLRI